VKSAQLHGGDHHHLYHNSPATDFRIHGQLFHLGDGFFDGRLTGDVHSAGAPSPMNFSSSSALSILQL